MSYTISYIDNIYTNHLDLKKLYDQEIYHKNSILASLEVSGRFLAVSIGNLALTLSLFVAPVFIALDSIKIAFDKIKKLEDLFLTDTFVSYISKCTSIALAVFYPSRAYQTEQELISEREIDPPVRLENIFRIDLINNINIDYLHISNNLRNNIESDLRFSENIYINE